MMNDFYKNTKLVYWVFEKYFKEYLFLKEDLVQEGFIALFNACKKYKVETNFKFSTYATRCIKNGMLKFINKENKHIKNTISLELVMEDFKYVL